MVFLHRFEQGSLCFRRRAVDFIGQHKVGENGAIDEAKAAASSLGIHFQHIGAGDVGRHQVRRELNALVAEVQCF